MAKHENELKTDEPVIDNNRGIGIDALPDDEQGSPAQTGADPTAADPTADLPDTSKSPTAPVTSSQDGQQPAARYADPSDQAAAGSQTAVGDQTVTDPPVQPDDEPNESGHVVDGARAEEIKRKVRHATGTFVDEPQQALQEMDALFDEASTIFTEGLAARRAGLRKMLKTDGSGTGTEELRLAVQEYRHLVQVLIDA